VAVREFGTHQAQRIVDGCIQVRGLQVNVAPPGQAQKPLRERGEPLDLALQSIPGLLAQGSTVQQHLHEESDRGDDVGHVVGDAGCQDPDRRHALRGEHVLLGLLQALIGAAQVRVQPGLLDGDGGLGGDSDHQVYVALVEDVGLRGGGKVDDAHRLALGYHGCDDRRADRQVLQALGVLEPDVGGGIIGEYRNALAQRARDHASADAQAAIRLPLVAEPRGPRDDGAGLGVNHEQRYLLDRQDLRNAVDHDLQQHRELQRRAQSAAQVEDHVQAVLGVGVRDGPVSDGIAGRHGEDHVAVAGQAVGVHRRVAVGLHDLHPLRALRVGVGLFLEHLQPRSANPEAVAQLERGRGVDATRTDEGAVGAGEVFEQERAVVRQESGMDAGDPEIKREADPAVLASPDHDLGSVQRELQARHAATQHAQFEHRVHSPWRPAPLPTRRGRAEVVVEAF